MIVVCNFPRNPWGTWRAVAGSAKSVAEAGCCVSSVVLTSSTSIKYNMFVMGLVWARSGVIRFCEQPKETKASRRAWSFFKFKYLWGTYDETEPTPELYLLGKHKNSFQLEGIDPQSCICWGNTSIPLRGIDPQSCVSVSCVTNFYVAQELNHTRGGSGGGVDPRICHPALMQTDWVCSRLWLWIFTDDKWSEK